MKLITAAILIGINIASAESINGIIDVKRPFNLNGTAGEVQILDGIKKLSVVPNPNLIRKDALIFRFEGQDKINIPVSAQVYTSVKNRKDFTADSVDLKQEISIQGNLQNKLIQTYEENQIVGCFYSGYCHELDPVSGRREYKFHVTCHGTQLALFRINEFSSTYALHFLDPENQQTIGTFTTSPETIKKSERIMDLTSCQ